jgi:trehalose 6-phosphate synthase/phosphatase
MPLRINKGDKDPVDKILIVSNRLPVSVIKGPHKTRLSPSPGGLATGLSSVSKSYQGYWVGWPGVRSENLTAQKKTEITRRLLTECKCYPIFLSRSHVDNYYLGFSNKTIWPLFHYFPVRTVYENRFWETYKQVNQLFCEQVVKVVQTTDTIWVHDYHLMLLPQLLREQLPQANIGFFLHIPFPSFELFRLLPWREQLLKGMLGADLVGFHTHDYARHFLSSVSRLVGLEHTLGNLTVENRVVKVDAFPLGIDYERYSQAPSQPRVRQEAARIRQKVGDRKIIISIDRLDYTKGIVQRLEAFDLFLCENPEYRGRVTLIMVAVPSRTRVEDYVMLRNRLEQLVGRVNGEYGAFGYVPVWYLYRSLPFEKLTALYHAADVALVTPLRDGMNLIAKEFVATKTDGKGVLILSEMTGAASELGEALIVNANNKGEIVQAIENALEMPEEQQVQRNHLMQNRLSRYNVTRWAGDFLEALTETKKIQKELYVRKLSPKLKKELVSSYKKAKKRLFFLDYDGTLVTFADRPEKAGPDDKILQVIEALSKNARNEVVIISGRDNKTLTEWLGRLNVTMIAEHGAWIKRSGKDWQCPGHFHADWKKTVRPVMELYADRTPRSLVEEKDFALVWHCRRADPDLAYIRTQELRDALVELTANLDVGVFEGNKILEVKPLGINKGRAAETWLKKKKWDFILTAGDDYTDEEMFAVMPENAYSIKVGSGVSKARFSVSSTNQIRLILQRLLGD